jgi:hypothetical protein
MRYYCCVVFLVVLLLLLLPSSSLQDHWKVLIRIQIPNPIFILLQAFLAAIIGVGGGVGVGVGVRHGRFWFCYDGFMTTFLSFLLVECFRDSLLLGNWIGLLVSLWLSMILLSQALLWFF